MLYSQVNNCLFVLPMNSEHIDLFLSFEEIKTQRGVIIVLQSLLTEHRIGLSSLLTKKLFTYNVYVLL